MTAITGTRNMLETARNLHIKKFVYLSSMEVYGAILPDQNPVTEEKMGYLDLTSARSCYPEGKRTCEQLCMDYFYEYHVPVCIARLGQTFGSGALPDDNRLPIQFAKCVIQNQDIVLHTKGDSISNFCYITDSVRAILIMLLRKDMAGIYNVCNDTESLSIREIAQVVADKIAQGQIHVKFDIPEENIYGYAAPTKMYLSASKLKQWGWCPDVSLEKAYKNLIAFLREI